MLVEWLPKNFFGFQMVRFMLAAALMTSLETSSSLRSETNVGGFRAWFFLCHFVEIHFKSDFKKWPLSDGRREKSLSKNCSTWGREGESSILASGPSCLEFDSQHSQTFLRGIFFVNFAKVNQQHCLEESEQWLENVDRAHLVLAGGKLVLQKRSVRSAKALEKLEPIRQACQSVDVNLSNPPQLQQRL